MGRYSTGSITNNQAKRIELSYLVKNGLIKGNSIINSSLSWNYNGTPSGSISLTTDTTKEVHFIILNYTITDRDTGAKKEINYQVELKRVPSNLGKGYRYYFVCPSSLKFCTILYMAYGSYYFMSRESYTSRIYYDCQIESKLARSFKYLEYESVLDKLYSKQKKRYYKGKLTKLSIQIDKIGSKIESSFLSKLYYS